MTRDGRGIAVVVSAPSGGGKTTICRRLIAEVPNVEFSISHTTRAPRGVEKNGVDYHFVDDAEFQRLVDADAFLEWAHVHDRRYGTSRAEVADRIARGIDVLLDIDVQGGKQVLAHDPAATLVFIVPPDPATLERRLRGRGSDSEEQIKRRLDAANAEIAAASFYNHWVINDDLASAVEELKEILRGEHHNRVDSRAILAAYGCSEAP